MNKTDKSLASRAAEYIAARDAALQAGGLADDDTWQAVETMELSAWRQPVASLGDVRALMALLQTFFEEAGGVGDTALETAIPARLGEAINLLSGREQ